MEDDCDDVYQDLVLTIHHCFMHTFSQSSALKIIENQKGQRMVGHQERTNQIPFQIQGVNGPTPQVDFVQLPVVDVPKEVVPPK